MYECIVMWKTGGIYLEMGLRAIVDMFLGLAIGVLIIL